MRKEAGRAVFSRPSFETTAFGGLLRMRPLFAAKSFMVRSVALATRLEP
jgi:hypothetical protein